jgi:hypothetical protein
MSKKEKYNSLVEAAYNDGDVIETCGRFDEDAEEGHNVELIQHGALWLVVVNEDEAETVIDFVDEDEAREAFDGIKKEIEEETERTGETL